jgi:hypothetical protein
MRFIDIINDVEEISLVKDQREMVKRAINGALQRYYSSHDWPYYLQDAGVIRTIPTYSTGTVSINNGSFTLTGSVAPVATAWTTDYNLAKIRIGSDPEWYRVVVVTATNSATIVPPYMGTNKTNVTYQMYKDEYLLEPDVDKYKMMRNMQASLPMFSMHPTGFDQYYPNPNATGDPMLEMMVGTFNFPYEIGTVSGTMNTYDLTGVGTAWLTTPGIGRMSQIRIGNNVYTVQYVNSDTSITTFEPLVENVALGTTYVISMNNLVVQLWNIPNIAETIYYRYFRIVSPLVNDYDVPDMPLGWHWLLMYGALAIMFLEKGDLSKSQVECEARFASGLESMKLKLGSFAPDRIYKLKSQDRMTHGTLDGLENSTFDRQYSRP